MDDKIMKDKIFYESENFIACVPYKSHVSREDGGHIWIRSKKRKLGISKRD